MRARIRGVLALTLAGAVGVLPAFGCAVLSTEQYSWSLHPSFPALPYVKGDLGIVLPTFARSYLVVAYRYLMDKKLTAQEIDQTNKMIEDRLSKSDQSCDEGDPDIWLKERKTVPGLPESPKIDTVLTLQETQSNFCNIQNSAFVTAAKTLKELVTKYGANNPVVTDWVKAQDMVFSNTGSARSVSIPAPLTTGDKLLQQDRAYQIAAANFYCLNVEEAQKLFTAIAADKDSPWSHISRYLAVRSLVRRATIVMTDPFDQTLMKEARTQLDALLADRSMADLHDSLLDLADFVVDKLVPADRAIAKQREHHLALEVSSNITARNLAEYTNLFDKLVGWDADDDSQKKQTALLGSDVDITDWINTYQSSRQVGYAHATARWQTMKSLPWLIAALNFADAKDAEAPSLLAAADKIKPPHCAFPAVSYVVAKLLMKEKKYDQARARIDQVLALKSLSVSDHNLLLDMKMQLARNLPEFIQNSNGRSLGSWSGDPEVVDEDPSSKPGTKPDILPLARLMYDDALPLSIMKTASESNLYTTENKALLAHHAWVKAIILGNDAVASAIATDLCTLDKKNSSYFKGYLQASAADKKFAAAYAILHDTDSTPGLVNGVYGNGWWWGKGGIGLSTDAWANQDSIDYQRVLPAPIFLTVAEQAAGKSEFSRVKATPAAPAYLSAIVVDWAKAHPTDPRVPEALHLAVRCTRYGERDATSSKLSKEAFVILHKKYAKNSWTNETPYFY